MTRAVPLVILVSVAVTLPGCLQGDDLSAGVAPPAPDVSPLVEAVAAAVPPAGENATPWWIVTVTGTPEGGLAGAWWSVPEGAARALGAADDGAVVPIEYAPILPAGVSRDVLVEWGLVAFTRGVDGLETSGGVFTFDPDEEVEPGHLGLPAETAGGEVGVVLFARTTEVVEFAVAFRLLDDAAGSEEDPHSSDAFLAAREGAPVALATRTGSGLAVAGYIHACLGGGMEVVPQCWEDRVGDIEVERGPVPAGSPSATPWSGTIRTSPAFERGWGVAEAIYFEAGASAATWDLAVEHHGARSSGGGVAVGAFPATALDPSYGGGMVTGEGEGGLALEFDVTAAGAPALLRLIVAVQVEWGATLEDLLGEPGASLARFAEGPLPAPRTLDEAFARALVAQR